MGKAIEKCPPLRLRKQVIRVRGPWPNTREIESLENIERLVRGDAAGGFGDAHQCQAAIVNRQSTLAVTGRVARQIARLNNAAMCLEKRGDGAADISAIIG